MCCFCTYNHTILTKMSLLLGTHTQTHTHTHSHGAIFPSYTGSGFSATATNPKLPWEYGVSLPSLHLHLLYSLPCLFVSLMFLFKASKDTPCPLPPSQHPPSPKAVRMICKLQTTKSPGLVSSAHLGNSISRGGEAQRHAASPFCPRCPCYSHSSRSGRAATNTS